MKNSQPETPCPVKGNTGCLQYPLEILSSPVSYPKVSKTSGVSVKLEMEDSAIGSWWLQCQENPDYVLSNLSLVPHVIVNYLAQKQLEIMCGKKKRASKRHVSRLEHYLSEETPSQTGNQYGSSQRPEMSSVSPPTSGSQFY